MRWYKPGDVVVMLKDHSECKIGDLVTLDGSNFEWSYGNTKEERGAWIKKLSLIANYPGIKDVYFTLYNKPNTKPEWL